MSRSVCELDFKLWLDSEPVWVQKTGTQSVSQLLTFSTKRWYNPHTLSELELCSYATSRWHTLGSVPCSKAPITRSAWQPVKMQLRWFNKPPNCSVSVHLMECVCAGDTWGCYVNLWERTVVFTLFFYEPQQTGSLRKHPTDNEVAQVQRYVTQAHKTHIKSLNCHIFLLTHQTPEYVDEILLASRPASTHLLVGHQTATDFQITDVMCRSWFYKLTASRWTRWSSGSHDRLEGELKLTQHVLI